MSELSGELPAIQCTMVRMPKEFRVIDETEDHYIFEREDKTIGATKKEKVRVVTISGFIE